MSNFINFLNTVDLNRNQLNNAAIQSLGSDPASPVEGQIYFNTVVHDLKVYANGAWKEVGATSGVESLSIGNAAVNAGGINTSLVLSAATGVITLTPKIYGGAANVGMVPTGGTANQYLDGAGNWVDVTTGDIESVNAATAANLLGINITTPLGPNPTVGLDIVGRDSLGGAPAVDDVLLIYDLDVTKNKKVTIANLKLATQTLYDLTTAPSGTAVRLTDAAGSDDVTISGTTGRTAMSRISASELRVDLTDDVTIVDDLTVGGKIAQSQSGETNTFASKLDMSSNKIINLATGTASTDAVNLGQVELLVAGVGVFQGGYNATNDPGVPVISGTSNVKLDQGDYFVVTNDGDITFSDAVVSVEVGDFIFAAGAIAANSNPASTAYTLVIADANVAGAGATDGGTEKGVSGFDSASFTVSSTGWVQLKPLGNPYASSVVLASGNNSVTGVTTFTVDVTALFGATASAANCGAEVVRVADLLTVYPAVHRNGTGDILFSFMPQVADSAFKALISIV